MELTFLGTGTSVGVPQIGCQCHVCTSPDPADNRLRCSALLKTDKGNLLIDCGPDFRTQMLRAGSPKIDAVLLTHTHYDHVGGVDDLRPYSKGQPFPIFCRHDVAADLRARVPYCFVENPYPGVPSLDLHIIREGEPFTAAGIDVMPIPIMHGRLPIVGFRIGKLAYITDCSAMPEAAYTLLEGVDTLVLNSLRPKPHPSHLSLPESIAIAKRIGASRTFFTHMSHDMGRAAEVALPDGMQLARDGQTIAITD